MDETRLADPHTLLLKGWSTWQDSLRLSDSHLTCILKTNSPCLYSHEDVYIFQCQQATIFTANVTLLFLPQLITTMYIQLQIIIYKSSVCCFTHMHTIHDIYVRCKKSSDAPITTKYNTLLNLFWLEVCAASCLTMVSVQSTRFISFNHSCRRFFLAETAGMR